MAAQRAGRAKWKRRGENRATYWTKKQRQGRRGGELLQAWKKRNAELNCLVQMILLLKLSAKPLDSYKQEVINKLVNSTCKLPIRSIVVPSSMVMSVTEAPKSRSKWTVSTCPFNAAIWRAVTPPSAGRLVTSQSALVDKDDKRMNQNRKVDIRKTSRGLI